MGAGKRGSSGFRGEEGLGARAWGGRAGEGLGFRGEEGSVMYECEESGMEIGQGGGEVQGGGVERAGCP